MLLPRLPADARRALEQRCVELCVTDFGLRVRLQVRSGGFAPARDQGEPALRISATGASVPVASVVAAWPVVVGSLCRGNGGNGDRCTDTGADQAKK